MVKLGNVAGKFLTQSQRGRVLQVGAAHFQFVTKLLLLLLLLLFVFGLLFELLSCVGFCELSLSIISDTSVGGGVIKSPGA